MRLSPAINACLLACTACLLAHGAITSSLPLLDAVRKPKYSGMTFTNERYCPNVTMGSQDAYESLQHLVTTGATHVAIVVTQYQMTVNSTTIFPQRVPVRCSTTPNGYCVTAADEDVVRAIRNVHALGMKVLLKPHIDLINGTSSQQWRGDIGTNMTRDDWVLWFASYTAFITHYAAIAETEGVALFSVSCELVTASEQEHFWRNLVVPAIRAIYTGLVTDAANWGTEAVNKTWWDTVDIIGIDEYDIQKHDVFVNGSFISEAKLLAAWRPVEARIEKLHRKWNKPVIFTEIGYCSGLGGKCFANSPVPPPVPATSNASLGSQVLQYHTALAVMSKYPWFEGVFWWNWATDAAFGGDGNACMDPKFKPTEALLRLWYNATVPAPPRPNRDPICKCWL